MPPDHGFHITWSKAAVILAALGVLQGAGYLVVRPRSDIAVRAAVLEAKVDAIAKDVDEIKECLIERRCGR